MTLSYEGEGPPVGEVFSSASLRFLLGVGVSAAPAGIASFYVYLPTFVTQELRLPSYAAYYTLLLGLRLGGLLSLMAGHVSDKVQMGFLE